MTAICIPVPIFFDTYDSHTAITVLSKFQTTKISMH